MDVFELDVTNEVVDGLSQRVVLDRGDSVDDGVYSSGSRLPLREFLEAWGQVTQLKTTQDDTKEHDQDVSCSVRLSHVLDFVLDQTGPVPEPQRVACQHGTKDSPDACPRIESVLKGLFNGLHQLKLESCGFVRLSVEGLDCFYSS